MAVIKILFSLGYALTVAAHGRVSEVVHKGVSYEGYNSPAMASNPNPPKLFAWTISVPDQGFVSPDNFGSPDIICHKNGKPGQAHLEVAAGDILTLKWTPWPESHHGPVMDYLANCNGPCETVDKTTLEFFKIDHIGLVKQNPQTFGDDILIANDNSWRVQIPENLQAGNYVLRHETIALHSAGSLNGAQAYPQCFNLKVTGSGTMKPPGVKGTALYKADDSGILSNIYVPDLKYEIPGPPVIPGVPESIPQEKFVPAAASAPATPGDGSGAGTTPAPDPDPAAAPAPATTLATSVRPTMDPPTMDPPTMDPPTNVTSSTPAVSADGPVETSPCDKKKGKGRKGNGHKCKAKGRDKDNGKGHGDSDNKQTQSLYGQCGGNNWTGPTECAAGATCKVQNPWYSQCVAA